MRFINNYLFLKEDLLSTDFIQPDSPFNDTNAYNKSRPSAPPITPTGAVPAGPAGSSSKNATETKSHMFQINFYRAYFDLDSDTFFQKIQKALNPFATSIGGTESTTDDDQDSPTELYGFVWITGTLIFLMFVSSTGANLLSQWLHGDEKKKYEYSFDLLTKAFSLFYGYNLLAPGILWLVTSYFIKFPYRISLTKTISIYGYTNVLWFPITIINILIVVFISNQKHHLMLNILEWIIVLLSGLITGLSNLSKLSPVIKKNSLIIHEGDANASKRLFYGVMISLAIAHLLFTVIVKISFFGIKV